MIVKAQARHCAHRACLAPLLGNMNFSRIGTGITKWFWVTIKGYLSYILHKFEDIAPTSFGSGVFIILFYMTHTVCSKLASSSFCFCLSINSIIVCLQIHFSRSPFSLKCSSHHAEPFPSSSLPHSSSSSSSSDSENGED